MHVYSSSINGKVGRRVCFAYPPPELEDLPFDRDVLSWPDSAPYCTTSHNHPLLTTKEQFVPKEYNPTNDPQTVNNRRYLAVPEVSSVHWWLGGS